MATTTAGTTGRCYLYQPPAIVKFSARDTTRLGQYLRDMDAATTLNPVMEPAELQLDERTRRTKRGGYTYTTPGFAQVTQLLAPGLSKLLPDLAGMVATPDDRDRYISGARAIKIFNDVIDLRFEQFSPYRVIRHETGKTIEGLVGAKHQFLENLSLYDQVSDVVLKNRPDVPLYGGLLSGRRLALWYRSRQPLFTLPMSPKPWPFYYGYYFCNGEATGMAVRGTLAVFTPQGVCLGPYRRHGGRVTHTGKEFFQRLGALFETLTTADLPEKELKEGAQALLVTPLGFGDLRTMRERRKRETVLTNTLSGLGIPQKLSRDIMHEAVLIGRETDPGKRPALEPSRLYASRMLFDLFTPLLRWALQLDFSRRERVEQAAYDVLTGKFNL